MAKNDSSKLSAKLKAIEVIVRELQKVDNGDRSQVVLFALKHIGLTNITPPTTNPNSPQSGQNIGGGNSAVGLDMSIDRFIRDKKPKDQYQRVAVIAYYLEHKENKKEFKNAEMATVNTKDARQSPIRNIADVITKAQNRHKFLTKGMGNATHQLSTLGADVVEALPDQEKVKGLIAGVKSQKPRKKKKAKK